MRALHPVLVGALVTLLLCLPGPAHGGKRHRKSPFAPAAACPVRDDVQGGRQIPCTSKAWQAGELMPQTSTEPTSTLMLLFCKRCTSWNSLHSQCLRHSLCWNFTRCEKDVSLLWLLSKVWDNICSLLILLSFLSSFFLPAAGLYFSWKCLHVPKSAAEALWAYRCPVSAAMNGSFKEKCAVAGQNRSSLTQREEMKVREGKQGYKSVRKAVCVCVCVREVGCFMEEAHTMFP